MMLPHDGIPRISSEGLEMVERGLKGDFSGWEREPANHPMSIPRDMLSNLKICADPRTMDFLAKPWFGAWPEIVNPPYIRFNGIDRQEYCVPKVSTILLTYRDGSRSWEFMTDLSVALDDLGCKGNIEESFEEEDADCCIRSALPGKTTLDAFL